MPIPRCGSGSLENPTDNYTKLNPKLSRNDTDMATMIFILRTLENAICGFLIFRLNYVAKDEVGLGNPVLNMASGGNLSKATLRLLNLAQWFNIHDPIG